MWRFAEFDLIDLPNNYFLVKLTSEENWRSHYRKILYDAPWVLFQHCILVQRWTPYFNPYQNQFGRIITWVRIPNIPMHCYNRHCIARIGERIGRPLRVDLNTLGESNSEASRVERGRYARICVELDLQKCLVPRIIIAEEVFNVEYEGLNLICFDCGRYGHRRELCSWKYNTGSEMNNRGGPTVNEKLPEVEPEKMKPQHDEPFGPWMMVSRSGKSKGQRRPPLNEGHGASAANGRTVPGTKSSKDGKLSVHKSRFAPLDTLPMGEEERDNNNQIKVNDGSAEMATVEAKSTGKPLKIEQGNGKN